MEITTPTARLDVPPVRDADTLRRLGALPPERTAVPIPTKALHAPSPTGPVLARLDPGQLRAPDGAATRQPDADARDPCGDGRTGGHHPRPGARDE